MVAVGCQALCHIMNLENPKVDLAFWERSDSEKCAEGNEERLPQPALYRIKQDVAE